MLPDGAGNAEHLLNLHADNARLRSALRTVNDSKFWRVRNRWFEINKRLKINPTGPLEIGDLIGPRVTSVAPMGVYDHWLRETLLRTIDIDRMHAAIAALARRPAFSIIMPVYNTPDRYLRQAIDSVLAQVYPDWELCIADDASSAPHVRSTLMEYAERDSRIHVTLREENGHIAAASNTALATATKEFIGLLDHDDILAPCALYENAVLLTRHPDTDMVYSDEDKVDEAGTRVDPYFKPDWSPDTFLTRMYTCHFGVYRRSLINDIGGFRVGFEGSQDYDLVLRLTEKTDKIRHIPSVLYSWRIHPGSVTSTPEQKPYAYVAAIRAIDEAISRRGEHGKARALDDVPGNYKIEYEVRNPERVTVIIPTRDGASDLRRCLSSLFDRTDYPDFEVILVDNGSTERALAELLEVYRHRYRERFKVLRQDIPFNFSLLNNVAARSATGKFLVFLNNDTSVIAPAWMRAMVAQAQRTSIGAVGAKLLYEDGHVQHAGIVLGIGGLAGHSFRHFDRTSFGYFNALKTVCNYSAVTAACLMVRREIFEQHGGFDENLSTAYNDVDLCLRIRESGFYNVFVPEAELYHYESRSRGYDVTPQQIERNQEARAYMEARWNIKGKPDPFYNQNLTLEREDFTIAIPLRTIR
jgi:O-antigen biosynthesis protein